MSTASEARERLRILRVRLRDAEAEMLTERQKEAELQRAYAAATTVRAAVLPVGFEEKRGR